MIAQSKVGQQNGSIVVGEEAKQPTWDLGRSLPCLLLNDEIVGEYKRCRKKTDSTDNQRVVQTRNRHISTKSIPNSRVLLVEIHPLLPVDFTSVRNSRHRFLSKTIGIRPPESRLPFLLLSPQSLFPPTISVLKFQDSAGLYSIYFDSRSLWQFHFPSFDSRRRFSGALSLGG